VRQPEDMRKYFVLRELETDHQAPGETTAVVAIPYIGEPSSENFVNTTRTQPINGQLVPARDDLFLRVRSPRITRHFCRSLPVSESTRSRGQTPLDTRVNQFVNSGLD
jgi:hypothetical protein